MGEKADWLAAHNLTEPELLRAAARSYYTWLQKTTKPDELIWIWTSKTPLNLMQLADELEKNAR